MRSDSVNQYVQTKHCFWERLRVQVVFNASDVFENYRNRQRYGENSGDAREDNSFAPVDTMC